MDLVSALWHLLHLLAPAWVCGAVLGVALASRRGAGSWWRRWWRHMLWLALPGSAVLLAGLGLSGADGRMATYGALVLLQGTLAAWRAQRQGA